jgi:peptide-methionine (R)-S-oxide reductase
MTDEWKDKLTPEQYQVLREKGTEIPGTGKYVDFFEDGTYSCAACGQQLFTSESKYESTMPGLIGWPAFSEAADRGAVRLEDDNSHGMQRTEVVCGRCGGHLGHVFDDGPKPTGLRYCMNSAALTFFPDKHADAGK